MFSRMFSLLIFVRVLLERLVLDGALSPTIFDQRERYCASSWDLACDTACACGMSLVTSPSCRVISFLSHLTASLPSGVDRVRAMAGMIRLVFGSNFRGR